MSRCGRTQHLEAVATGEATAAQAAELRAHAKQCALCRHELNWLETEAALFRNHAGRDEVANLWAGVAKRRGLGGSRPWSRVLVGVAAMVLAVVGASQFTRSAQHAPTQVVMEDELESSPLMSPAFFVTPDEACSRLPTGLGFHCGPAVPASFLASR